MIVTTNLLIFLLSIFFIGAFIIFLVKRSSSVIPKKLTYWLLLVYFAILLLSAGIVGLMGENSIETVDRVSMKYDDEDEVVGQLYQALNQGDLAQIDRQLLTFEDRLKYEGSHLDLNINNEDEYIRVYVERKESNDHEIEVYVFGNSLFVDGYNFSDDLLPPSIQLKGDVLTINPSEYQKVQLWMLKKEFTVNQFKKDSMKYISGTELIEPNVYLRIPKDLQLRIEEKDFVDITFVN